MHIYLTRFLSILKSLDIGHGIFINGGRGVRANPRTPSIAATVCHDIKPEFAISNDIHLVKSQNLSTAAVVYTYLVYLVIKLTHYRSALNFCFIEAIDWSFTVVSCRLFYVSTTRFEKKFFLMSVRLYCFIYF